MLSESNPTYQIEHYVNGLLFLLQSPNVDSRLNSKVTADASKLKVFVRESMLGKTINGMKFPCVLSRVLTFEENMEIFMEGLDSKSLFVTAFGSNTMAFSLAKLAQFVATNPTTGPKFTALLPFMEVALAANMDITLSYAKTSSGSGELDFPVSSLYSLMLNLFIDFYLSCQEGHHSPGSYAASSQGNGVFGRWKPGPCAREWHRSHQHRCSL